MVLSFHLPVPSAGGVNEKTVPSPTREFVQHFEPGRCGSAGQQSRDYHRCKNTV
jgi:hypothetical protein